MTQLPSYCTYDRIKREKENVLAQQPPIVALFPELASCTVDDFRRMGTDRPTLMIAMTARTGSTHLCSGLSSVLPVGKPTELLNGRDTLVYEKQRRQAETFADVLKSYFSESEEKIIFKTSWVDFSFFQDKIFDLFRNLQVIYLNRMDVEAQGVSLFKAVITGHWHESPSIKAGKKLAEDVAMAKFDLLRICRHIAMLEAEKYAWEAFFFKNAMQPARINYESFQTDLASAVRMIAKHLGCGDVDTAFVKSEFKVLSDAVSEDWLKKVRNYRNGNFYLRYKRGELPPS